MGTMASLMLADGADLDEAQRIASDVLGSLDERFSSYRSDSEVSRLDAGVLPELSRDLRHVLAACDWLDQTSDGVFSMRPDGADAPLDVAGYVKGWAVDRAADGLLAAGIGDFCLGVGGDWRAHGRRGDGRGWTIAILDPLDTTKPRALATLGNAAIATSGRYERGDHLRLPPTARGGGTADVTTASFTVVGPRLAWADAFATTAFLKGDDGLAWVAQYAGYFGAIVRTDGSMVADVDFPLASASAPPFPGIRAPYAPAGAGR
ncbi:MAG: FAD:protein transferase [Actinomycetota bacterium]|nr:FAD:protein transferase [Actinomycetota bacterium]